jgi:polysaccharide export outer membrane protein
MTITQRTALRSAALRSAVLRTAVLATVSTGFALAAIPAAAQGARTVQTPIARPAPAPATRTASAQTTTTPIATPAEPAAARSSAVRSWTDQEYRLGAGDKLRVEVYHEPQLSQSLQVRPDGKITLPLVGDIVATGQTSMELRDALANSLKEYVTNPVVTVIVTDALAAQVYVIGEVGKPGAQVMQGPMTVLQALAQAGGLKEFANKGDIRVLRRMAGGRTTTLPFDYKEALRGRVDPMPLQPGDTVVVP